jgi:uncharacterized protein (DUF697 family)
MSLKLGKIRLIISIFGHFDPFVGVIVVSALVPMPWGRSLPNRALKFLPLRAVDIVGCVISTAMHTL